MSAPGDLMDLEAGRTAGPLEGAALERARATGERLRSAFAETCAEQAVLGRLAGPAEELSYEFDGQENAPAELILEHFVLELQARGLRSSAHIVPDPTWSEAQITRACEGLQANVRRVRNLLVEHNSFLSGGVPWVFAPTDPAIMDRGIARYRFPATGAVDLDVVPPRLRIAFQPGPLGDVTSSGYYVPTHLRGDFRVEISYRIVRWLPGDEAACLALFVHDEPALARYYAQRSSCREDGSDHSLLANFSDSVGERTPVRGDSGTFRIVREGLRVTTWHRTEGEWLLTGEHLETSAVDMFVGAKVWSKGECGGLEVLLENWVIVGTVPDDQPPRAETRPDPRDAPPA